MQTTTDKVNRPAALMQAIRDYEMAHAVWMNNSVFTPRGIEAKRNLDAAREVYLAAMRKSNPTWIIA